MASFAVLMAEKALQAESSTEAEPKAQPTFEAPSDEPTPVGPQSGPNDPSTSKPKRNQNRSRKMRVLGEGEGDFAIYEIARHDSDFPHGTLLPLPNTPRFTAAHEAMRWMKAEGEAVAGKQVMILRACEIVTVRATQKPHIEITPKAKIKAKEHVTG